MRTKHVYPTLKTPAHAFHVRALSIHTPLGPNIPHLCKNSPLELPKCACVSAVNGLSNCSSLCRRCVPRARFRYSYQGVQPWQSLLATDSLSQPNSCVPAALQLHSVNQAFAYQLHSTIESTQGALRHVLPAAHCVQDTKRARGRHWDFLSTASDTTRAYKRLYSALDCRVGEP